MIFLAFRVLATNNFKTFYHFTTLVPKLSYRRRLAVRKIGDFRSSCLNVLGLVCFI